MTIRELVIYSCLLVAAADYSGHRDRLHFDTRQPPRPQIDEPLSSPQQARARVPELPQDSVDVTWIAPTGASHRVKAGDNLQRIVDRARRGDEIVLPAGSEFTGNFVLPAKSGTGWVTIRSDGALPEPGHRATHRDSLVFARVISPNAQPAIRTAAAASGYRLVGLEIMARETVKRINTLVALGDGSAQQNAINEIPRDIILDRVWIHGHRQLNIRRCVALNSAATAIIESTIEECHDDGFDSQAVWGWNGPGPFLIQNNYLEGASENVGFGGGIPQIRGLVPSDIIIRRNHIAKPAAWKGGPWLVKNLIEFKNARRVLIEDNLVEGNWLDGQAGFALQFTPRGEDGGACATWCTLEDVTMRYNHVRRTGSVLNLAANPDGNLTHPAARIRFEQNLFDEINVGIYKSQGRLFVLQDAGLADVAFIHNTALGDDMVALFSGRPMTRIEFQDNILGSTMGYGFWSSSNNPQGLATLAYHVQGWRVVRNVLIGLNRNLHPGGNWFPRSITEVSIELTGPRRGALSNRSAFRGRSAGRDPGVNATELAKRLASVAQPDRPDGERR